MKKLLFILPALFFVLGLKAQQTEDEVYIGKKFGIFNDTGIIILETDRKIKPNGLLTAIDTVLSVSACTVYCSVLVVKLTDGTPITVGTADRGFSIPAKMVGRGIMVDGAYSVRQVPGERPSRIIQQQNIGFAATGIKVIN